MRTFDVRGYLASQGIAIPSHDGREVAEVATPSGVVISGVGREDEGREVAEVAGGRADDASPASENERREVTDIKQLRNYEEWRKFVGNDADPRAPCWVCAAYSRPRCMVAWRGELQGVQKRYEPAPLVPRNCPSFKPKA